ncbi:hypothetical protein DT376_27295, partial [Pseudomonas aeruginosa]
IEHKRGIHGNATCVMNFDAATGFLIGPPNKGLNCMFTFMNTARLGTALQGLAHAEVGFQGGIAYARERLQMRSLTGPKAPEKPADPIIVHPDVRRMLLTMKAFAEGNRAMLYFAAKQVDIVQRSQDEEQKKAADSMLAFLTPIAKAFMTEVGFESANHGVQIFGGHGFIAEHGMEQNVRDSRISMLYEGTTGVQALDLLGRKVLMTQGEALKGFTKIVHKFCQANEANEAVKEFVAPLAQLNKEWGDLTMKVGMAAMKDREEVGAASVDYLMYSGYACLAYFWADMARLAAEKLAASTGEEAFFRRFPEEVSYHVMGEGFTWETQDRQRDIAKAEAAWKVAAQLLADPDVGLVVLDELNIALKHGYLELDRVLADIQARPAMQHVVVTGRGAQPGMIEAADTVTEMSLVKHAFKAGIKAQKGVEF